MNCAICSAEFAWTRPVLVVRVRGVMGVGVLIGVRVGGLAVRVARIRRLSVGRVVGCLRL